MSERDDFPAGAPCWVDTAQRDVAAAEAFYGELFGWSFAPSELGGEGGYRNARLHGLLVAGLHQAPDGMDAAIWSTYVRVADLDQSVAVVRRQDGDVLALVDAAAAGRLAVIVDPAGAALGLWQAAGRAGAQLVNESGTWAMSALHTPDPERASAFYASLFGWQTTAVPSEDLTFFSLPGYRGGEADQAMSRDVVAVMSPTQPGSGIPPHWAVNFRVDDADAVAARAEALGGRVLIPPTDGRGFRSALIGDPQGGVVAVRAPSLSV
jgi:predicted enzyme related to lactoylglutathione lyase